MDLLKNVRVVFGLIWPFGLSAFFSSGTHRLASKLGGWMMELFAGCGLLLMGSACTLCASPDGDTARKCSLATLSLLSAVFAVVVIACFWFPQPLFERMGEAVGGEIEEIFVDLRTAGICGDPAGGGGNTTSPERCWDCCDSWEEAAGEPENGCLEFAVPLEVGLDPRDRLRHLRHDT